MAGDIFKSMRRQPISIAIIIIIIIIASQTGGWLP